MIVGIIDQFNAKRMPGVQQWRRQQTVPSLLIVGYLLPIVGLSSLSRGYSGTVQYGMLAALVAFAIAGFFVLRGVLRKHYPNWNESYWDRKKRHDADHLSREDK